ncbi:hypothetical protein WA026_008117 [Henosepilachna vigintioctopunctata]|uniref:Uncharacterized protein n=1 Tax=Henosepilachna vigintioctopunctata TaxID=420089 RepID=A0AAW1TS09_9CUCU
MNIYDNKKFNIFKKSSTYLDDYQKYDGIYRITPDYARDKFEKPEPPPPPPIPFDKENFVPLKKEIPMSLMIVPNEITGCNPHKKLEKIVISSDDKMADVIKTRPRVYCSPQVSLDDVPDPEMRKLLLDYMYTTDFRKADLELLSMVKMEQRVLPDTLIEHGNFVENKNYFSVNFNPKPSMLYELSAELNSKGAKWTNEQLIAETNATELFWKNKDVKCGACYIPMLNLVGKDTKQKIRELIDNNTIRMPHDHHYPGYTGYAPELAVGVDLEIKNLPCSHPLLSTSQVLAKRRIGQNNAPSKNT